VRESKFWELMEDEFGASYAGHLARSHHLFALGGRTVLEALVTESPRTVWFALCDDMDVPEARRFGRDDQVRS
jgi:hypothetical protein